MRDLMQQLADLMQQRTKQWSVVSSRKLLIEVTSSRNDLVALDFVELDPLPGRQQGLEGLKQQTAAFCTALPDIHWVIEEMVGEGDKVFGHFTWRGIRRGEFFGFPGTGRQITVQGMVVERLVADKMVDDRILMNGLGMMTRLGVSQVGKLPAER